MYFIILDFDSFKGTKIIVLKVYQDKSLVHDDDPVQYFKQLHLFAFFQDLSKPKHYDYVKLLEYQSHMLKIYA